MRQKNIKIVIDDIFELSRSGHTITGKVIKINKKDDLNTLEIINAVNENCPFKVGSTVVYSTGGLKYAARRKLK